MRCLICNLPELLEASMPLDEEMVDLKEQAFLEGQIDGLKADLADFWLGSNSRDQSYMAQVRTQTG
jgi:hypothetical protein